MNFSTSFRLLLLPGFLTALGCDKKTPPAPAAPAAVASTTADPRSPAPASPVQAQSLFSDATADIGLPAGHVEYADGTYKLPELEAGCVALLDPKNDGRLSILVVVHPQPGPDQFTQTAANRLFQQNADGKFVEVPNAAGLQGPGFHFGVAVGDFDNDGFADVLITNFGAPDLLFHNNRDGTYTDVTARAGLPTAPDPTNWSTAASFFDYDGDGNLDLMVAHYATVSNMGPCNMPGDPTNIDYCGPHKYPGQLAHLYHNNGDGTFTDVSKKAGIQQPAHGLGLIAADLTGNGRADIFQADDREPNQYWANQGDGTFVDEAVLRGCAFNSTGTVAANMGMAVGDVFNRAQFDLLITHMTNETNVFFKSNADGTWIDWTPQSGMAAVDRRVTGWGVGFFDFDNDGNLDCATANGRIGKGAELAGSSVGKFWGRYADPNYLFKGDGQGRFADVSAQASPFTSRIEVHHALAFGDLWNRGAVDLVEVNVDNSMRVFRNDAAPKTANHWLQVLPIIGKRDALGARVTLTAAGKTRVGLCLRSYSYLSSNDPRVHFGLGTADHVDPIEIAWPSGSPRKEKFTIDGVDRTVTLRQGTGHPVP